jgi:hypothetical protein
VPQYSGRGTYLGLDHNTANNHLAQRRMQGLEIEDQIQLADILKQAVQGLDIDLDEVDQGQRALGAGAYDDEIQRGIVAVGDEGRDVVVRCGRGLRGVGGGLRAEERWQWEEVAGTGSAG